MEQIYLKGILVESLQFDKLLFVYRDACAFGWCDPLLESMARPPIKRTGGQKTLAAVALRRTTGRRHPWRGKLGQKIRTISTLDPIH